MFMRGSISKMSQVSIYGYIIPHDTGFSPCYANGIYTLGCCKPRIRKSVFNDNLKKDTWIIGLKHTSKNNLGEYDSKIVYIAHINKILKLEEYYTDKYKNRIDCIYRNVKSFVKASKKSYEEIRENNPNIKLIKNPFAHKINNIDSPADGEKEQLIKDIDGNCVLYSNEFYYLGDTKDSVSDALKYIHDKCKVRKPGDYFKVERLNGFDIDKFKKFIDSISKYKNRKNIKPFDDSENTGLYGNKYKSKRSCKK